MDVNIKELSSNNLDNLEQRRLLVKHLARKMILETRLTKFTKWLIRISIFCIAFYFVYHDITYGHFHFIHTSPLG